MKLQVIAGTKEEIADAVLRHPGDVREVIVVLREATSAKRSINEFFAELDQRALRVGEVDDSRESLYSPDAGA